MRFNYPLVLVALIGVVFWLGLIALLFNSAGCSTVTPC